jgi:tetratricopeptide (TPR) repeat protein
MMIGLMQVANSRGAARPIVLVGVAGLAVALGGGCRRPALAPAQGPLCAPPPVTAKSIKDKSGTATGEMKDSDPAEQPPRPLRRCFPEQPAWVDAPVADLLDKAALLFDKGDYTGTLACAEEAARAAPRSVEAHHNRAIALMRLDRLEEARDALELALALAPDDPETLEAAADLQVNQLPPSGDRSALGLEYARRGSRHVPRRDVEEVARLALLEGQALIDLGRAAEALRRIDAALVAQPHFGAAVYERGVALFELCRFDEARATFTKVLAETPDHAHALYHLGLIEERAGDEAAAGRHLAAATAADPKSFPPAPQITQPDFEARVRRAVAALPADFRRDISGVTVQAADLPDLEDLTAEKPPLSPTILGLFRGLPLDYDDQAAAPTPAGRSRKGHAAPPPPSESAPVQCDAGDRAIVLYRRNLLRTVKDGPELDQAITRTLLHEVGHLRGEDDGSLRDRGLE